MAAAGVFIGVTFMLYHAEYAREGKIFRADSADARYRESLHHAEQGWTDDPAKLGINPWGEAGASAVAEKSRAFRAGEIPAIDPPDGVVVTPQQREEEDRKAKERADLRAAVEAGRRQQEGLAQRKRMSEEKLRDSQSDAGLLKKDGPLAGASRPVDREEDPSAYDDKGNPVGPSTDLAAADTAVEDLSGGRPQPVVTHDTEL